MNTRSKLFALVAVAGCTALTASALTAGLWTAQSLTDTQNSVVIDDGDPGFKVLSGVWSLSRVDTAQNKDVLSNAQTRTTNPSDYAKVSWTFTTQRAKYDVWMTWPEFPHLHRAVPVAVWDGSAQIGSATLNQTQAPATAVYDGKKWLKLGSYELQGGRLTVDLTAPPRGANAGVVAADAVRIVKASPTRTVTPLTPPARTSPAPVTAPAPVVTPTPAPSPTTTAPPPATTSAPAATPFCGDRVVSGDEQCDDGNRKPGDGCNAQCRNEVCGDGTVSPTKGEECDDANAADGDGCSASCKYEYCGDGAKTGAEECDDGNVRPGDGCSGTCAAERSTDLSITVTHPQKVNTSKTVTDLVPMTIKITNNGPADTTMAFEPIDQPGFMMRARTEPPRREGDTTHCLGDYLTCNGSIAAGASLEFTFGMMIDTDTSCDVPRPLALKVRSKSAVDTNPANDIYRSTVSLACPTAGADLGIQVSLPQQVKPGADTVAVKATNNGPSAAEMRFTVELPGFLKVLSVEQSTDGTECRIGAAVECKGPMAAGATREFVLRVEVRQDASCNVAHPVKAAILSETQDPNSANNTVQTAVTLACAPTGADIAAELVMGTEAVAKKSMEMKLRIVNKGPGAASAAMIRLPFNSNYFAFDAKKSDARCTYVNNYVDCTGIDVAANAAVEIPVTLSTEKTPCTAASQFLTSTWWNGNDSDSKNNVSAVKTVQFRCETSSGADMAVSMEVVSSKKGTPLTLKLKAQNKGPADAAGVLSQFGLGAEFVLDAAKTDAACARLGTLVRCTGNVKSGETKEYTIVATGLDSKACGSGMAWIPSIWAPVPDADQTNNVTPQVNAKVECDPADLSTEVIAPAAVQKGQPLEMKLRIANAGPGAAKGSMVRAGFSTTYFAFNAAKSDTRCKFVHNYVDCTGIDVEAGATVDVAVTLDTQKTTCGMVTQFKSDTWSPATDPNKANNLSGTKQVSVACGKSADVSVTATAPATVQKGGLIEYAITLTNAGPDASGAGAFFSLPPGMTVQPGSSPECTQSSYHVRCGAASLANGESKSFKLLANAAMDCGATMGHLVRADSTVTDSNQGNNASQPIMVKVTCSKSADISVTATAPATVRKDANIPYSIVVSNAGPDAATGAAVYFSVPTGAVLQPGTSPECTQTNQYITCKGIALEKNASKTLTVLTNANLVCGGTLNHGVTAGSALTDPNPNNNQSAPMSITVTCEAATKLIVAQKTTGSAAVVARGAKNVVLLRFEGHAEGGDVRLWSTRFAAAQGSVYNAKNYTLWADTDDDGSAETAVLTGSTALGNVAFDAPRDGALVIADGKPATFEVRADIVASPDSDVLRLVFETSSPHMINAEAGSTGKFLVGQHVDGVCDNGEFCDIRVVTVPSVRYAIRQAMLLSVAQKSIGSANTAVRNAKDVNLLRFDAYSETGNVRLTGFRFASLAGSVLNAQNYTLWADTDDDGRVDAVLQSGVSGDNLAVHMRDLTDGGFTVPANKPVAFEVHADISSSLIDDKLQLAFATGRNDMISAESADTGEQLVGTVVDGQCDNGDRCAQTLSTTPSVLYTLVERGNLYVTKDNIPVRTRQILAGTVGDPILRLNARAENEDVFITALRFGVTVGSGKSIERLDLYREGETNPFASASRGGCGDYPAAFCAEGGKFVTIAKGTETKILVRPRMKNDEEGAVSGEAVAIGLVRHDSVIAVGEQSSNTLIINDSAAAGAGRTYIGVNAAQPNQAIFGGHHVTVLSKLIGVTNAAATGATIPTGAASPIGKFKFAAAQNNNSKSGLNKTVLADIIFTLRAENVAFNPDSLRLYNESDSSVVSSCYILDSVASPYSVACWGINRSGVNTAIDQGTDQTFVLQADITNPQISSSADSVLQVSLENFSNPSLSGMSKNSSHIQWFDTDGDVNGSKQHWWIEHPETVVKSTEFRN